MLCWHRVLQAAISAAHQRLDELAAAAQAAGPQAFPGASTGPPSAQQRLQQLEVLSQVWCLVCIQHCIKRVAARAAGACIEQLAQTDKQCQARAAVCTSC